MSYGTRTSSGSGFLKTEKNKNKQPNKQMKKKKLIVWIVTQSVNTNRIQVLTVQKAAYISLHQIYGTFVQITLIFIFLVPAT